MDVSKDAATYDYGLEFCAGQKTSRVRFRPDGAGRQNAQVACRVAANAAVELRIWLLRAAFHGEFGLLGAKMTRLHPQSDAAGSSCESEYAS